jgi:hypothetical protein
VIVAHLPAGYLLARSFRGPAFAAALAGAVVPDLDMLAFHLIHERAFHHHHYWVHIPGFWALVGMATASVLWSIGAARHILVLLAFLAGVALHLVLDGLAGGIAWAWPLSGELHALVDVPARFDWWVWNFLLHWTFALELAICTAAGVAFLHDRRARSAGGSRTMAC